MAIYQDIDTATRAGAAADRVMTALVAGLETEFGRGAAQTLAGRFLKAEEVDFRWDARLEERWLGCYESPEDAEFELDRIAIHGQLDGTWFSASMLVDGDGRAHGMTGCRRFDTRSQARDAMLHAH